MTNQPPTDSDLPSALADPAEELFDDRQLPRAAPPPVEYGLALSGGGIRATLFHLGAIWRINQMGHLRDIGRITSVSGGSFAAAFLAMAWGNLQWDERRGATNLGELFARPILRLSRLPLDAPIVAIGLVPGVSPAGVLAATLDAYFMHGRTLRDLPDDRDGPRFVFNATELSSGTDWRFSRPYMGSYRIGLVRWPTLRLADAVAASAAFPPLVSPLTVRFDPASLEATRGADLHDEVAALGRVQLTDGGAYDNMGLAPIMRRARKLLISDAGGNLSIERAEWKWAFWSLQTKRILDIAVSQERAQRRRNLIAHESASRPIGYWRTLTDPNSKKLKPSPFAVHEDWPAYMAGRSTRLWPFPEPDRHRLVNWGYLLADIVLRTFIWKDDDPPTRLPFPDYGFESAPVPPAPVAGTL